MLAHAYMQNSRLIMVAFVTAMFFIFMNAGK